jgi:hypothetical protein
MINILKQYPVEYGGWDEVVGFNATMTDEADEADSCEEDDLVYN